VAGTVWEAKKGEGRKKFVAARKGGGKKCPKTKATLAARAVRAKNAAQRSNASTVTEELAVPGGEDPE